MSENTKVTIDGNAAAAHVAYAFSEIAAIYPITPSSTMGEYADSWASIGRKNAFGKTVDVVEMQSEAGAAGAVHGSLTAGALTTTFTASQGLLLMIPNMHKIAGEMLPTVFHVSARSLACQSLSIFGDHSDVMSVRNTGFALMAANSIQETMDLAVVSHLATLKGQIPFLNFFDGFRTSHEVMKVDEISYETISKMIEPEYIEKFRERALRPDKPVLKVGAQNPDVYFQGRETVNKYYSALPAIIQEYMDKVGKVIGRKYHLFDYVGAKDAEKVIIAMGSGCDTIELVVNKLVSQGKKVGLVKVRLFRPFSVDAFINAIPSTCKKIAVLDRTKEPGAIGEPLYTDVAAALNGKNIKIIGGRYGLSSKEFTPAMAKAVFDHIDGKAFHDFTVGIEDDVTNLSIPVTDDIEVTADDVINCIFWGFGSDGTVGANKNSIKIIGENTNMNAQAYFVYDSKKSGGITTSHLRFGKSSVNMPFLIKKANFIACHNPAYIGRYDMLSAIKEGGTFLLNSEFDSAEVFNHLSKKEQEIIIQRKVKFYNIDALKIAEDSGLGGKINTVMQAAFFKISGVLPENEAIDLIKSAIKKSFIKKGEDIVKMNWDCVDKTSEALKEVKVPSSISASFEPPKLISDNESRFAVKIIKPIMYQEGDKIPVSEMSFDGTIPTATSKLEKRGIAPSVPKWLKETCIQCNQCVMACPHATIRAKQIAPADLKDKPKNFDTILSSTKNERNLEYRIQVYTEDCIGCGVCIDVCPGKNQAKALEFSALEKEREANMPKCAEYFDKLPNNVLDGASETNVKGIGFKQPLFEFSGACAGCGETPYIKLATQLFGENMMIANATGCSSIYGGTFPTVPYCKNNEGRGPTWANSLFEDNAEYGFGMRLAIDNNRKLLRIKIDELLKEGTTAELTAALKKAIDNWDKKDNEAQNLKNQITGLLEPAYKAASGKAKDALRKIIELKDYFLDKSIWIFGGDGWAYDIGYGGLDHVVASGRNVNLLVLDTEVYSNTGGQASKATPIGAVANFATAGKRMAKKNLGFMCISYGYVYVASIAMGANRAQTIKAFAEAEAYNGPSIIIAYAPCIAHGIDMSKTQNEQRRAVESGYWPLYRYNPSLEPGSRFIWETKEPKESFQDFIRSERRYTSLFETAPADAEKLFAEAEVDAKRRMDFLKNLGGLL
ncbi:MAG: pyruvate:ferredoxin (flavodoxin) oxidoreductase [Spirochaetaceae bacterium]|nr:pyruvate:ferredoxin (flavodoxin) oxidoreductase [Spirochaetaceae bacterium]